MTWDKDCLVRDLERQLVASQQLIARTKKAKIIQELEEEKQHLQEEMQKMNYKWERQLQEVTARNAQLKQTLMHKEKLVQEQLQQRNVIMMGLFIACMCIMIYYWY